ncbi:hypothetical protein O181_017388 [Austropuccinia psidii MF-1]|uniref:Uncharacterized protein n=1 Tax=Austropuccinia psidii MF-1 TaxID=1389203 RepID=A0A9Q3C711_9BASI|nr:hypothetical protein [Austropuccinia psidii MF-1]
MFVAYVLAPMILAATGLSSVSVISPNPYSPPTYGAPTTCSPALKNEVDFNSCVNKFREIREPIVSSCKKNSIPEVRSKLNEAYAPLKGVSVAFHSFVYGSKSPAEKNSEYSRLFVQVLVSFDAVLNVFQSYSNVAQGCYAIFSQYDAEFSSISSDFERFGIDVHNILTQTTFDITRWSEFGFKFQKNFGFTEDPTAHQAKKRRMNANI